MMKRIVIRHGRILDIETGRADLADMLIEDGTIKMIGAPDMAAPGDAEVIDATDRLLVPGLVNGHTHAHGGLGKGLVGDRVPLEMFLSASMAMNGRRSAEDKYLSAALSAVEMVRRGCTAAYDLVVEFPLPSVEGIDAVAQAYHDVGMRAVVAPMMADRSLYQALPGLHGSHARQARRRSSPHRWRALSGERRGLPHDPARLAPRPGRHSPGAGPYHPIALLR